MVTGATSEIGLVTAQVLAQRFVQRWDLHARQLDDGSYVCVHEQLNVDHLFAHLRGEITLGVYLLDQESQARFIVLDADDEHGCERLGHLARALAGEDVPAYLERSRRGGHLWLFLAEAVARHRSDWGGMAGSAPLRFERSHTIRTVNVGSRHGHGDGGTHPRSRGRTT